MAHESARCYLSRHGVPVRRWRVRNLSSSFAKAWMSVLLSTGGPRVSSPIERNESMKLRRAR